MPKINSQLYHWYRLSSMSLFFFFLQIDQIFSFALLDSKYTRDAIEITRLNARRRRLERLLFRSRRPFFSPLTTGRDDFPTHRSRKARRSRGGRDESFVGGRSRGKTRANRWSRSRSFQLGGRARERRYPRGARTSSVTRLVNVPTS